MEPRRREKKAVHGDRKDGVVPDSFKLQTELLAERRMQQREEREVAQLRHAQQKIMGRKTVEDFAQLKLLRRETAAPKSRSLHCNGRQTESAAKCKRSGRVEIKKRDPESKVCLESRPLQSAREASSRLVSRSLPQRPQSAKPVLQTHSRSSGTLETMAAGSVEEAALLADRQTKAHVGKKKKKRKSLDRKPRRLESSSSTPVLSQQLTERGPNSPACKKISIVVNMRNLQLQEGKESSNNSPPRAILAWGD